MKNIRYQIQLNENRTTVVLDETITELLAIKLNKKPGTKEAHKVVVKQLEIFIPDDLDMSDIGLEKYLTRKSVLFLTDTKLRDKYWQFHFNEGLFLHYLRA